MTIIEDAPTTGANRHSGTPAATEGARATDEQITGIRSGLTYQLSDRDPEETQEWLDSFDQLVESQG
ncbi:hypothetical protein ACF046_12165, partial [Glutamicibacter creatinolyticus]|uniref:hypothetical protein n=1 Tax=Glutamicibacter creatinolyticus TaxID=162496 RepID=UPI0033F3EBE1